MVNPHVASRAEIEAHLEKLEDLRMKAGFEENRRHQIYLRRRVSIHREEIKSREDILKLEAETSKLFHAWGRQKMKLNSLDLEIEEYRMNKELALAYRRSQGEDV